MADGFEVAGKSWALQKGTFYSSDKVECPLLRFYATGREDTASAMEFGIGVVGGLGPSGVYAVGVRLDNAGLFLRDYATDVTLAGRVARMRAGGRLNAVLSPDPAAFNAFLSTLRDGRQIRVFLKEIEDELLKTYNAEFQALLRRRIEYPDAAKHIAALVEERMKLAGIRRGLNVDTQVIVNHLSDGIIALRRDNLTSYRIADLQIASGQKIIIELTLEDIRSLRGMADWRRMSGHKNGQLSDYAISGAHIIIITPW